MSDRLVARFARQFPNGPKIEADLRLAATGFSCTVIVGPSGGGKSTILRCLAGLDRPTEGTVSFCRETWCDAARGHCRSPQERRIGFVFQDYALFPHLTVAENVGYGLPRAPRTARRASVAEILERMKLTGLEHRYPHQISGGQQQRVALARAMVRRPRLLLLDEPLAALDPPLREKIRRELRQTLESFDVPTVIVTHDRLEAQALADQLILLDEGRILQTGTVAEVFNKPANAAAARIVGVENVALARLLGTESGQVRIRVEGIELLATRDDDVPQDAWACVRAEDVQLDCRVGAPSSVLNRLEGRVLAVTNEGASLRVELDCGWRLAATIARSNWDARPLSVGDQMTVRIQPESIRVVPMSVG